MKKSKIVIEIMKWVSIKQKTNAAGSTQAEIRDGKILRRREWWVTYLLLTPMNITREPQQVLKKSSTVQRRP